jgi:hypothetical protein
MTIAVAKGEVCLLEAADGDGVDIAKVNIWFDNPDSDDPVYVTIGVPIGSLHSAIV